MAVYKKALYFFIKVLYFENVKILDNGLHFIIWVPALTNGKSAALL